MNFEKIINYFRRLGQAIRTRFAGFRSKRGDKSFNERKSTTDSKWNRKQVRKSTEDRMTLLDMGDVFLKTLKLLSDFFYVVIIVLTLFGAGIGLGIWGVKLSLFRRLRTKPC